MKALMVCYADSSISISSAFAKKAFTPGTNEYNVLMSVRNDFPNFKLITRKFKTNTKQDHYKGLTYNYMREYINKVEGKDAHAVLEGLEFLIDISKCHSPGKRYATVKDWFLKRYPEIKEFGVDEEKFSELFEKKAAAVMGQTNSDPNTNKITNFETVKTSECHPQEEPETFSDTEYSA